MFAHLAACLRPAWILASRLLILSTLVFSPILFFLVFFFSTNAKADLKDISRIYHSSPSINQFEICQGGGCVVVSNASLSAQEWNSVARIFNVTPIDAADERKKIAQAIGMLEDIVGKKIGTSADLAGTFFEGKLAGQQDCNDEAINSTTYMRLLKSQNLIKLHEIEDMRTRNFFFTGWPHTTAVIHEIKTGERYAVDSWFYDNGHAALIVPFKQWKANYKPLDSPIGKLRNNNQAKMQQ
jgi:hypothetical protein